jgi:hypothetical protein
MINGLPAISLSPSDPSLTNDFKDIYECSGGVHSVLLFSRITDFFEV